MSEDGASHHVCSIQLTLSQENDFLAGVHAVYGGGGGVRDGWLNDEQERSLQAKPDLVGSMLRLCLSGGHVRRSDYSRMQRLVLWTRWSKLAGDTVVLSGSAGACADEMLQRSTRSAGLVQALLPMVHACLLSNRVAIVLGVRHFN